MGEENDKKTTPTPEMLREGVLALNQRWHGDTSEDIVRDVWIAMEAVRRRSAGQTFRGLDRRQDTT